MATTPTYINQRINNLQAQINAITSGGVPTSSDLAVVLGNGNSAGTSDIDMNNQDITSVNNIDLVTINGSAYPPSSTPSSSVFNYKAHTNSQAPPISNGQIEWNNLTQASATLIYISHQDDDGDDIQVLLSALPLGTIFLIQDQTIGSNYQRWTITSVSSIVNQYITFGVTLLTSTHSFSNNDPVLLIIQSANQNLSQVLAVGNSAGVYDIDLNNNDLLKVANVVGSSSAGVDLNISSVNNIIMSADNIDIGTTEIIYPTLATPARVRVKASGQVQVDNNGGGVPATVLNQVSLTGGVLVEEVYNQRTHITNSEYSRQSFYAKNSGNSKTEYARISQIALNTTSIRGGLSLSVSDGGAPSPYITLSGSNTRVDFSRRLNMGSYNIENCPQITTPNGITYATQLVQILNGNGNMASGTDTLMRQLIINAGIIPSWIQSPTIGNLPSNENPTASALFQGGWFIGTKNGDIFYSYDFGVSWSNWGNTGGRINVLQSSSSGSYLFVGGQFSNPYNNGFYLDGGLTAFDITGDNGFNSDVFCFFENVFGNIMYIGGAFTSSGNGGLLSNYWWNFDFNSMTGVVWDNGSSVGFNGGVRSINFESSSSLFIAGGDFTDFNGGGAQYFVSLNMSGTSLSSFFNLGFNLDAAVYSLYPYSSGMLVGGYFTNTVGASFCNTKFGLYAVWNGISWDLYDYPYFAPIAPVKFISNVGGNDYTVVENGSTDELYNGGTQMPSIPIGNRWNVIAYNGSFNVFATDDQVSLGFPFYQLNTASDINIDLTGLGQTLVYNGGTYSTNVNLQYIGSSFESIYNGSNNTWYVINTIGGVSFS